DVKSSLIRGFITELVSMGQYDDAHSQMPVQFLPHWSFPYNFTLERFQICQFQKTSYHGPLPMCHGDDIDSCPLVLAKECATEHLNLAKK
ncbi:unnamed protein product, partial [Ilex paraguariensis]